MASLIIQGLLRPLLDLFKKRVFLSGLFAGQFRVLALWHAA